MHEGRITLLLAAGVILALSACSSALACSPQSQTVVSREVENPAEVWITVQDTRDEERGGDVNVHVSPWRVVVDAEQGGVIWRCPLRCQIILEGRAASHLRFVDGQDQGDVDTPVQAELNLEELATIWREDSKAIIAGAYSIKIWLKGNETITIDPDHLIDPRRPGSGRG
jgi:hypothetical protein